MNNIAEQYDKMVDMGYSIIDLYIYHCVVNNEEVLDLSEREIEELCKKILNAYSNDYECRDLSYHINKILYDQDEDWDEWE